MVIRDQVGVCLFNCHSFNFFFTRDLIELGAKIFFPKFCTGDLDHISIKLLQLILLKIALLLGVRFFTPCSFVDLDPENCRPILKPHDHPLSYEHFDVIVGASGARSVLPGFQFAEDRRCLAIGITANFKNKNSLPEQQATEISGVARQFNAQFFDELNSYSGIDIENLVYYKGDTHYFVCTARKASVLQKGVLVNDFPETEKLLSKSNVARFNLCNYMKELANICTAMTIPDLEYELIGSTEDTAIFDFTSSFYAKHSSRAIINPNTGKKLLMCLVGDSLRLPFWPEGTGCPRGFLSSYDTAWLIQNWFSPKSTPLECLALRECVYGLYSSTKPDVLYKNFSEADRFHLDPQTRYRQLDLTTAHLHLPKARALIDGPIEEPETPFSFLCSSNNNRIVNARHKRHADGNARLAPGALPERLKKWCLGRLKPYQDIVPLSSDEEEIKFNDGMALCCILHSIRPSAVDLSSINPGPLAVETFLNAVFREFTITPQLTSSDIIAGTSHSSLVRLLMQLYSYTNNVGKSAAQKNVLSPKHKKKVDVAAKAEKLKELGRGLRQQRKSQLNVEELLFGGEQKLTLEEKKMRLKELFLLGQIQSNPQQTTVDPETVVGPQEFEDRKTRLRGLLLDSAQKTTSEGAEHAKTVVEMSESLRDRRDLLVKKLLGDSSSSVQKPEPQNISKLLHTKKNFDFPDSSKTANALLASFSSSWMTDEQKQIARNLFEQRLKGQRKQSLTDESHLLLRGPPPVKKVAHMTVGDRKKQLQTTRDSKSPKNRHHPDESAHIPVSEMKERLKSGGEFLNQRHMDPMEKPQTAISEISKKITSGNSSHDIKTEKRSEIQLQNQDYQPTCYVCSDRLYVTERMMVGNYAVHRECFRCVICRKLLRWTNYATVENKKTRRSIFVCPCHCENDELEEYMKRCNAQIGEVQIEQPKKTTTQVPVPAPAPAPVSIVEEKKPAFQSVKIEVSPPPKRINEPIEIICPSEEEEDDEEVEEEQSETDSELYFEETTEEEVEESDSNSFLSGDEVIMDETTEDEEEEDTAKSVISSSTASEKPNLELSGKVQIDSWLHQQLQSQRQQKLMKAKQAFLTSLEPTTLPVPKTPEDTLDSNGKTSTTTTATSTTKNFPNSLVLECESDDQNDSKNGDIDKLAEDYTEKITISPSSPRRGFMSKLSGLVTSSKNKSAPVSPEKEHTTSSSSSGETSKWKIFANNLFSRKNKSQQNSPNGKSRSRPDSVDVMLYGSCDSSSLPSPLDDTSAASGMLLAATERKCLQLRRLMTDKNFQTNNPSLAKDASKLINEISVSQDELMRVERDLSAQALLVDEQKQQMLVKQRNDLGRKHSDLLLKFVFLFSSSNFHFINWMLNLFSISGQNYWKLKPVWMISWENILHQLRVPTVTKHRKN